MHAVYLLVGVDDKKFYVGLASDLRRRLHEHRTGKVRSTHERGMVKLVYFEAFANKQDARRREQYLKTTKGRNGLRLILRETLAHLARQP